MKPASETHAARMAKAAIVEEPGILVVREVPVPEIGPYDALCEMLYGVTCSGTDQHLIAGRFPWPVSYPTILGHESVGRIVQVGLRVRHLAVRDLVTRVGMPPAPDGAFSVNWGGFAEVGVAKDHRAMREDGLAPESWRPFRIHQVLPADVDPRAATMVVTWRETLSYLTRMGAGAGDSVLVVGSGGNGLAFVAHAAALGAARITMVGNAQRRGLARAAGATGYVDYRADDPLALVSAECPDGFDLIIDAVGKSGAADDVLGLLKPGGTIGIYGIDDYSRCPIHPHRARGTFTCYNGGYDEEETHDRVLSLMRAGQLDAALWLDLEHPFALEDIDKAIEAVRARAMVKALVRLAGDG